MASQGPILHEDMREVSALAGYGIRRAGVIGILTNANVTGAATAEDLEAIVEAGLPGTVHSEYEVEQLITDRSLKFGDAIGDFSDSRVAAATSVEDLAEKTTAADEADLNHHGPRIVG